MGSFDITIIRTSAQADTALPAVSGSDIIVDDDAGTQRVPESVVGIPLTMKTGFPETAFFADRRRSSEILFTALRCYMCPSTRRREYPPAMR